MLLILTTHLVGFILFLQAAFTTAGIGCLAHNIHVHRQTGYNLVASKHIKRSGNTIWGGNFCFDVSAS